MNIVEYFIVISEMIFVSENLPTRVLTLQCFENQDLSPISIQTRGMYFIICQ